ncbi:MAG: class I SAM-dependent methyltransferase [Pseudolabrys sp.]
MASSSAVETVDKQNIAFWNELCGTGLAKTLGITDNSAESLKKFDDWYFDFYPYLYDHIHFDRAGGKKVLEIGLGYGTVAQKLMESGANYHGLDIANGPVEMAQHRARLLGREADVHQGSALAIPYPDETFDYVVTIGCLHHTGDLARAMIEVARVLKKGGEAMIMVYSAVSYRHWKAAPGDTLQRRLRPQFEWTNADVKLRKNYDMNQEGSAAPETTFISPGEARQFLGRHFRTVRVTPRNIGGDFAPARFMSREKLNAVFERWVGLDLYIECVK